MPNSLDCVFKVTSDLLQRHEPILWNDFDTVYFDLFTILIVYYGVKYCMSKRVFTLTEREKQSLLIRINQPARLYLLIWWRLPWSFVSLPVKIPVSPVSRSRFTPLGKCGLLYVLSSRFPLHPSFHPPPLAFLCAIVLRTNPRCGVGGGGDVRMSVTYFLIRKFRFDGSVKKITLGEVLTDIFANPKSQKLQISFSLSRDNYFSQTVKSIVTSLHKHY